VTRIAMPVACLSNEPKFPVFGDLSVCVKTN
jgi:hypothetical protein